MLIGSKLPPDHIDRTYFSSGRAAFSYLVGEVVKPRKVYLPAFTCWSLVSAMQRRFAGIEIEFYPVTRDLSCRYPACVDVDELLVYIHFFGYECPLPYGLERKGTLLEDWSHAYLSQIKPTGDYVFGSYRKIVKVADGGFIDRYFNPVYEPSRKLDTWLRYESKDWRDVREAENMTDRDWQIADISSQSLAVLLGANGDLIRHKRRKNEAFLQAGMKVGSPLLHFRANECPLLHNRLFATAEERNSVRAFLASRGVFTSIHWPTHPAVRQSQCDIEDVLWLEEHILSIPVSHDYGLNDMEYIVACTEEWSRAGT
jgi:hypothetical protein